MADLILTGAHHLLIFSIVAVFAAEIALVRPGLSPGRIRIVTRLDASYGTLAALILAVGFLRVFFGLKLPAFYFANPLFWAKIGAFATVGLLSVAPTIRILGWRRRVKADEGYSPSAGEVRSVRRFFIAEAIAFAPIPILAAAMARGHGL